MKIFKYSNKFKVIVIGVDRNVSTTSFHVEVRNNGGSFRKHKDDKTKHKTLRPRALGCSG
jgi:hypothetical protein